MGASEQQKGKTGELELSDYFNDRGYKTHRGRSQSYGTEPDIIGLPGIHCEVKRVEHLNISNAMVQAVRDAIRFMDGLPTVFHRRNREGWLVTMRLKDWMKLYEGEKMLNQVIIMGRLVRNPELRHTQNNDPVASFTVAVDRDYSKEKQTDFIDCVAWRNTADFITKYGAKGRMVVVCGRLQFREWDDKNGMKHRDAEIVVDNLYFGDNRRVETTEFIPPASEEKLPF